MSEFLIDLPYHKRWMLPDGEHYYNSVLYGDHFHVTICRRWTGETVLSLPPIYIDEAGKWQDHLELAQELAKKRFCAKRERQAAEFARSWRK